MDFDYFLKKYGVYKDYKNHVTQEPYYQVEKYDDFFRIFHL